MDVIDSKIKELQKEKLRLQMEKQEKCKHDYVFERSKHFKTYYYKSMKEYVCIKCDKKKTYWF